MSGSCATFTGGWIIGPPFVDDRGVPPPLLPLPAVKKGAHPGLYPPWPQEHGETSLPDRLYAVAFTFELGRESFDIAGPEPHRPPDAATPQIGRQPSRSNETRKGRVGHSEPFDHFPRRQKFHAGKALPNR